MSAQPPAYTRFSLKGWLFGVWFQKNKGTIKLLFSMLGAYLTIVLATVNPPELKAFLVLAVGLITKFGADVVDYWFAERPE